MPNKITSYKAQKGFTLVELAIVLVIIGLIVSSVIVGQDLIKAAQLRATTRQFQEFQTGVNTFIGKYNGLPGDLNNGTKFGLTGRGAYQDGTAGNGDGNGILTSTTSATAVTTFSGEMSTFWSHLTTTGKELITGSYNGDGCNALASTCTTGTDYPAMKFGGTGWGAFGASGINYLVAGVSNNIAIGSLTATTNAFIPVDAFNIDVKIDDGVPDAGNVQSRGAHATNIDAAATTNAGVLATTCNNTTPTPHEYQLTATTAQCTLRFQLQTF